MEPAHGGEWMVAAEEPGTGLFDESYACQRCHMLGSTVPGTGSRPEPGGVHRAEPRAPPVSGRVTRATTVEDFMSDAIRLHGRASASSASSATAPARPTRPTAHANTGVVVSSGLDVLGKSQVCGQCHGSYTNVAGTMGIYGYTTNLALRDFVDINGVSGGQSYTKIPTEEEFAASPTAYWMFPNGSNAKGNHYYYNEWAASAHSYRSALTKDDPDAMAFQAAGNGHYSNNFDPNLTAGCYKCHTGEGYLQSKDAPIADGFVLTKDNVGMMGQECSTCHNGHPSGVGAADVVRDPDKAGERSATGLSVDNASICEDCHNWQIEVTGQQPKPAPMADLAAHGSPSHPQRETLHGRSAMFDTANGKRVHARRRVRRLPHAQDQQGRHPHLPRHEAHAAGRRGDGGTAWPARAYQGEDSCTGCHPSQSRSAAAGRDRRVAGGRGGSGRRGRRCHRRRPRPAASSPPPTPPSRATCSSAGRRGTTRCSRTTPPRASTTRRTSWPASMKAEQMAKSVGGRFSYTAASSSVRKGKTAHVAGRIVNGDGSNAAGGEVVLLRGTKVLDTAVADAKGHFAFTFKVTKTYKNYKVKWVRSSSPITSKLSKAMTIKVR